MYRFVKRGFDLVFSILAILCFSWLYLVLFLVVYVTVQEGPIFIQKRIGKDEKEFDFFKFKTMVSGVVPNKTAHFLRITSLDELPQVFNVLKGEMSFVGPRPLLPEYLPLYSENQKARHAVLPGITGLVQVSGGNALDWKERMELDIKYIQNKSLSLDFLILWKTIFLVKFIKRSSFHESGKFKGI